MHEPLLDVDLPNDAVLLFQHVRAGEAAEKVIVIRQIFTNVAAQENLRAVCRLFAEAGVRLLAVEGADGRLPPRPEATSVAALLQTRCRVSAGVEVLLNVDRPGVVAWGVVGLDSEALSLDAMTRAQAGAAKREQVFRALRRSLAAAQGRCYPAAVARLRQLQCAVYGRWKESSNVSGPQYPANLSQPFAKVAAATIAAAGPVGLAMREFPTVVQYQRLLGEEKVFDQRAVTVGQRTFLQRLKTHVLAPVRAAGGVTFREVEPVVQFWALRLGVPFFDLRAFRRGLAYNREAAELSAMGLFD
jgi:hypothetical protein